ncbi:uncharacterized protein BCR38DRAFT_91493 [Pseudomassariella vexata]|uniref:C2H2-type domain-containing protein n=1 Tax=Pseudomassariella vexata TaxID=1141098 RepID=A0A1Y2EEN8_9PEZI|nr:uncharacterized protein BCR38DRAFT_91493 [Pseudomassariella vexata]ORY69736.1 hypothetical protein BCR38DRAFT_91493 [Pseudomassariella vexata]
MRKRKATDKEVEDLGVPEPKRRGPGSSPFEEALDDDFDTFDDNGSEYGQDSNDGDNGFTTGSANTPLTSHSGMSPRRFPSDLKTIKCTYPDCDKAFNRPARLVAHLRSHKNERPYKCPEPDCEKSYVEQKHLKQHIKGFHTKEREYTCPEAGCGKSFLTSTRLKRHQDVHAGAERFRCRDYPPCNQSFRKHNTLQRHIRAEHLGKPAFACTQRDAETKEPCDAAFDTAAALKRHNQREHGDIIFFCDECKTGDDDRVGFPTLELLHKHMQKAHINCPFCERVFPARTELDNHIETQHSKSTLVQRKNVPCTWPGCNKSFVKKYNLNVHVRSVHEGLRYVCGEVDLTANDDLRTWPNSNGCGNGFVTKANLEDHVRYVHLGMTRPQPAKAPLRAAEQRRTAGNTLGQLMGGTYYTIPCTVPGCTLKFVRKDDITIHMQTHHREPDAASFPACSPLPGAEIAPVLDDSVSRVIGLTPAGIPTTQEAPGQQNATDYMPEGNWEMVDGGEIWAPDPSYQQLAFPTFDQQWWENQANQAVRGRPVDRSEFEGLIDPALEEMS